MGTPQKIHDLPPGETKTELVTAAVQCAERSLHHAAKWASELANGLPADIPAVPLTNTNTSSSMDIKSLESDDDREEHRLCVLGKSYFELKEYRRAAWVLRNCDRHPVGRFLHAYALYMAGEKKKEDAVSAGFDADRSLHVNDELPGLLHLFAVEIRTKTPREGQHEQNPVRICFTTHEAAARTSSIAWNQEIVVEIVCDKEIGQYEQQCQWMGGTIHNTNVGFQLFQLPPNSSSSTYLPLTAHSSARA